MVKVTNSKTVKLSIVFLIALALAACNPKTPTNPADTEVAATVNGKEIKLSEVDSIISLQTQGRQGEMTPVQMGAARLQVLSKLIEDEVLYQKAEKEKFLPTDDETGRAIEEAKKGQTQEAFDKALKDQGLTAETFRDKIKRQLAVNKMQEKYTSGLEIKDKEVEDFYNANKDTVFVNKRGAELATIVVDVADNGLPQDDAKDAAQVSAKMSDIMAQLNQKADFADIARRRSEAPNAAQGGDMGFIEEDQMRQQFGEGFAGRVMGSKAGDLIGPFQAGQQFILIKVKRVQTTAENLTLESPGVRERATEALRDQRKQLILGALLEISMTEAKIFNFVAEKMVKSPNTLGGSRFATGTPSASPGASPAASPSGSPATKASPAGSPAAPKASPKQ